MRDPHDAGKTGHGLRSIPEPLEKTLTVGTDNPKQIVTGAATYVSAPAHPLHVTEIGV